MAKQARQGGDIGPGPTNVYFLLWGARGGQKSATFTAHDGESTPIRPGTNKAVDRMGEKHRTDEEGNRGRVWFSINIGKKKAKKMQCVL